MCLIYIGNIETVQFKIERFYARIYASCSLLDVGQINGIFHWYCSARIHKNAIILHRLHSFNLTETTKIQCDTWCYNIDCLYIYFLFIM